MALKYPNGVGGELGHALLERTTIPALTVSQIQFWHFKLCFNQKSPQVGEE